MEKKSMILNVKVTSTDQFAKTTGKPYRIISIPASKSLFDLAEIINDSFHFDFDRSFGFYDNLKNWTVSLEGYEVFADKGLQSRYAGVKNTKISDVFSTPGKKMLYIYDYGDTWRFMVEVVATFEKEKGAKYPKVIESHLEGPMQFNIG
jgi:hypothetical protein